MTVYHIITLACLVFLLAIAAGYTLAIAKKQREQRIDFIRKFKKGNCIVVYFAAIPLFLMESLYLGETFLSSLFRAIDQTMGLVVLRFDTSALASLMAASRLFTVTVYLCYVLVLLNATLFALSFLHQKLWEGWQALTFRHTKRERVVVVGYNEECLALLRSVGDDRTARLLDSLGDSARADLYRRKLPFLSSRTPGAALCHLIASALSGDGSLIILIHTGDDERNVALCHAVRECVAARLGSMDAQEMASTLSRVRVYVFGSPAYETVYTAITDTAFGCLRYVNKYRCIAMDFIDRYPLTEFMTEEHLDFDTSLVREGVSVNVAMVGFGNTGRQIFLTSVANNQLLTAGDEGVRLLPVRYHIFDKEPKEANKNLNHSYFRFQNELAGDNPEDYLPLPEPPADARYAALDVNDPAFYEALHRALDGKQSFNYIVIAYGSDLENVDMAHKLAEKRAEWGLAHTYLFVKVRSGGSAFPIFDRPDVFPIGEEAQAVYHIDAVDDHAITEMAKHRNRTYALEYELSAKGGALTDAEAAAACHRADCAWYTQKTEFERESNVYACLSLRAKLHMMGLDYVPRAAASHPLSEEEYLARYAGGDLPEYADDLAVDGKRIIRYGLHFADSRRTAMAIHEHYRWNSFMLTKGFIPATREQILASQKNGKDYALRRHGNLTTFAGLLEFRRMIAERDGKDELATDVIKYDYQLLDDAFWLLLQEGYAIIEKGGD